MFVKGTIGLNVCPYGSHVIIDVAACKLAANELKMQFTGEVIHNTSPKGCVMTAMSGLNVVYLNTHSVGKPKSNDAPICKRANGDGNYFLLTFENLR